MKKFKTILFLLATTFFLMACPVGLEFPAEIMGANPIDQKLLGTWKTNKTDTEITKMKLTDNADNTYTIDVLERGEMFMLETDHLKGWITKIGNYDILIAKPDNENKYYHYAFRIDKSGELIIADISLLVGGIDAVTSTEALRNEILESSKLDSFITEERIYQKVN